VLFWLVTLICAAAGAYLGSYLKKKGENLATKEDIAELTRATKEIEAKISHDVWNRQRQWEMKRDSVIAAIQALSATEDALMVVSTFYQMSLKDEHDPKIREEYEKATLSWKDKITIFETKRIVAKLVCGDEFNATLSAVRVAIRIGMKQIMKRSIQSYDEIGPSVSPAMLGAIMAARKELGLPAEDLTFQSSES
jgi:hypothetical protein